MGGWMFGCAGGWVGVWVGFGGWVGGWWVGRSFPSVWITQTNCILNAIVAF